MKKELGSIVGKIKPTIKSFVNTLLFDKFYEIVLASIKLESY